MNMATPAFASPDASVNLLLSMFNVPLNDDTVTEICVNRPGQVYVEAGGEWRAYDDAAVTYDALSSLCVAVAKYCENDFSRNVPILSATLPGGQRLQAVHDPACSAGTISITIRKPSNGVMTLADYSESGFFKHVRKVSQDLTQTERKLIELKDSGDYAEFLRMAVSSAQNIVIAGETGSGKTTFMKALMQEIPKRQRIITIEDVPELSLPNHDNHVHLFYSSEAGAGNGKAVSTSASLLKSCLRMKPDRILLAELRGAETFDFINVCASGHGGSITSCHAGSAELTFERLAMMVMSNEQGRTLPYEVIKQLLYLVVDVVVHVTNSHDGNGRHITELWYEPQRKRSTHGGDNPLSALVTALNPTIKRVEEIHDVVHTSALLMAQENHHDGQ